MLFSSHLNFRLVKIVKKEKKEVENTYMSPFQTQQSSKKNYYILFEKEK